MSAMGSSRDDVLSEGDRRGRFVVVRNVDGRRHALAATAIVAISEEEDGDAVILLPGGRALRLAVPLPTLLGWLDARG